jgi:aryl-alcohol dehydrogenase-like predicted oxidoreductase
MTELGLGTVQLGVPYGNNASGSLMPVDEAYRILNFAIAAGIRFFDTAQAYGDSESRLGSFDLMRKSPKAEVSTKLPRVERDIWSDKDRYLKFVREACLSSCSKLGVKKLGLLQFHQCDEEFLTSATVQSVMNDMIAEGLCESIGISVYEPAQGLAALEIKAVSALQVPANVIDTRFLAPSLLSKYKHRRTRVLVRSIFMQGVLLSGVALPPVRKKNDLNQLRQLFLESLNGAEAIHACFKFVLTQGPRVIDTAIIGVDSLESLKANIQAAREALEMPEVLDREKLEDARQFALQHNLLNPALWNVAPLTSRWT